MSIANEERRVAVARLRAYAQDRPPHRVAEAVELALGRMTGRDSIMRLADLIEPDEGQFRDAAKTVDVGALLELAAEMEAVRRAYIDRPVLLHGAPVLLRDMARRIREACGAAS